MTQPEVSSAGTKHTSAVSAFPPPPLQLLQILQQPLLPAACLREAALGWMTVTSNTLSSHSWQARRTPRASLAPLGRRSGPASKCSGGSIDVTQPAEEMMRRQAGIRGLWRDTVISERRMQLRDAQRSCRWISYTVFDSRCRRRVGRGWLAMWSHNSHK